MIAAIMLSVALAADPAKVPAPPAPPVVEPAPPVLQPQCPIDGDKVIPSPPNKGFPVPPELPKVPSSRWHWTAGDYVREALVLGLIGMDWKQTRHFRSHGVHELNAALGPTPSRARVNTLIAVGALAHIGIAIALPHGDWRTGWQLTVGGAEAISVYNNARQGW